MANLRRVRGTAAISTTDVQDVSPLRIVRQFSSRKEENAIDVLVTEEDDEFLHESGNMLSTHTKS